MKKKLAKEISTVLMIVATLFATTACIWIFHRPEVPEELL